MQSERAANTPQHGIRQHGAMEFTDPPAELDQVRMYRLGRIREQLQRLDYAGVLLFDQVNTRYATDATNMQIWCSHYETRCVFVATEGPVVLFDYGNYPHLVEGLPTIDEYRKMPSFYYFTAGPRASEFAAIFVAEIDDLVSCYGGGNRRLAIDRLSFEGTAPICARGIEIHDGLEVLEQARVIKSNAELMLMRASIDVCQRGMQAMYDILEPGITENALWAKLHQVNIEQGGEWIETRLLSSGPRTNPWFRESSMRKMESGDLVSFDTDLIGPYGYCADISRSWLCGDVRPTDEQRRLYAHAFDQIETNIERLKPGMTFREVSLGAWKIPSEFEVNRYGSLIHGVGLADEYPSIKHALDVDARGYEGVVLPGMTLCVESYIGAEGGREGVKLEEQVLVTDSGVERLSNYPYEMDWL
ncbi:MAG: peptidase M24 [marine bacterium B5-7]|nr:MAG: peptidase M24 [marine bacterium B5-7]